MPDDNPFAAGAGDAAAGADDATAAQRAKLKAPTWAEVRSMLPDPQDQEELDALIDIVNRDTAHNKKVAALINDIDNLAGVVVKTLGGLV